VSNIPTSSNDGALHAPGVAGRMRRLAYDLRTEGGGAGRESAAIGLGVFIGCSPFYGLHLAICILVGWLFRLNRLKLYLAANVSNPLMAPILILTELQAGAWIRRGEMHGLTLVTARTIDPWVFGADVLIGSLVVGALLGGAAALATWFSTKPDDDSGFSVLARRAADRYVGISMTAWEFARAKLRADPLYKTVLTGGLLPSGGTLVDVGTGQGLMLALLAEASEVSDSNTWPADLPPPPRFERLVGIDTRPRVVSIARRALGDKATVLQGDAREHVPRLCRVGLFFDVLQMMTIADQERLLASVANALEPGGVILVREVDAAAGWRFVVVSAGNRAKALLSGNWSQTFHFRTAAGWTEMCERLGFRVTRFECSQGTPFANVLFALTDRQRDADRLGRGSHASPS
jgi:uncharacterized protein (DUF2062 family)/SAM-dependent methyltransferase